MHSLVYSHSVADIISLVSNEIPLDTGADYQESQSVSKAIIDDIISVNNLEPLEFLTAGSKLVHIADGGDLESRPENVAYVRFRCNMDGVTVDKRVTRGASLYF